MIKSKNIEYIHFDTIDSTNNWVKKHALQLDPCRITCITALEQTAGRGRWNRTWFSPKEQNIYATIYFCIPKESPYLENIPQVLALSCAQMLRKKGFLAKIKWPNDVLVDGKKIAGILCETVALKEETGVVLGIGINVNMQEELLKTIDQPATSLAQLSGRTWNLEQTLSLLLESFLKSLTILQQEGLPPFLKFFEALLASTGKENCC
ncbi:MAG: biotin--[acetyl-CoA-carboxylase] ligase [Chlamydiae bacterium RIFCSPLOWO2_12_FULL_49_12]|nr:MAG: biotin--[acetyl-CoA-carboxylase] ligase [Chlamydiae bacterium RIFCSPHIGHO2_02_FULL_49_29]OGN73396.1 MAG: biotin--[acetyl-CoA-carboxylase] ligase [Chlamydiae bacterium RIFCSPLOWO2_12_FULL_49_12]